MAAAVLTGRHGGSLSLRHTRVTNEMFASPVAGRMARIRGNTRHLKKFVYENKYFG